MSADGDAPSPIMTAPEVCDFLKIGSGSLYKLIRYRKFPAFKIGSYYRFNREALYKWLAEAQRTACGHQEGSRAQAVLSDAAKRKKSRSKKGKSR